MSHVIPWPAEGNPNEIDTAAHRIMFSWHDLPGQNAAVDGYRDYVIQFLNDPVRGATVHTRPSVWLSPDGASTPSTTTPWFVSCPEAGTVLEPWESVTCVVRVPIPLGFGNRATWQARVPTGTPSGTSTQDLNHSLWVDAGSSSDSMSTSPWRGGPGVVPRYFQFDDFCMAYGNAMEGLFPDPVGGQTEPAAAVGVQMSGGRPLARTHVDWSALEAWHLDNGGNEPTQVGDDPHLRYPPWRGPMVAFCIKITGSDTEEHAAARARRHTLLYTLGASPVTGPTRDVLLAQEHPYPGPWGASSVVSSDPTPPPGIWLRVPSLPASLDPALLPVQGLWVHELPGPWQVGVSDHDPVYLGGDWWQIGAQTFVPDSTYEGEFNEGEAVFPFRVRATYRAAPFSRPSYVQSSGNPVGSINPIRIPYADLDLFTVGPPPETTSPPSWAVGFVPL